MREIEKAISFCLFGDKPIYTVGMKCNMELREKYYPDWEIVVFHDGTVSDEMMQSMESSGVWLIHEQRFAPMFARFLVNDIAERWIVRDTDCRLSKRERVAVDAWIDSGKMWHTMADDAAHVRIVQGAMWGGWNTDIDMEQELMEFGDAANTEWGADEDFLCDWLWPKMEHSVLAHHHRDNPIDWDRTEVRYVGQAFTEDGRGI